MNRNAWETEIMKKIIVLSLTLISLISSLILADGYDVGVVPLINNRVTNQTPQPYNLGIYWNNESCITAAGIGLRISADGGTTVSFVGDTVIFNPDARSGYVYFGWAYYYSGLNLDTVLVGGAYLPPCPTHIPSDNSSEPLYWLPIVFGGDFGGEICIDSCTYSTVYTPNHPDGFETTSWLFEINCAPPHVYPTFNQGNGPFCFTYEYTPSYICGDIKRDSEVNVTDVVWLINYIFNGGQEPFVLESADTNCDGSTNVSDAVWIMNYIFYSGNNPCDVDGDGEPDC
jgi:Dockerin type I domain